MLPAKPSLIDCRTTPREGSAEQCTDVVLLQCQLDSGPQRRPAAHDWHAHGGRYMLCGLQHSLGLEICEALLMQLCCGFVCIIVQSWMCSEQEAAVEESQKYKEGKYILEKAKIMKVTALPQRQWDSLAAHQHCCSSRSVMSCRRGLGDFLAGRAG